MFSAVLTTLDLGSAVGGWWSSLGTGDQATWVSSLVTGLVLLVTAWAATAAARAAGAASRLVEIETERRQDEKNAAAEALKASRRAQAERISARYVRGEVTGGSEVVLVNHSARPVFKVQVLLHGDSECSRLKDLVRRAAGTITPVIQPGCHVIDVLPPTMSSPVVEPVLSAWRPTVARWEFNGDMLSFGMSTMVDEHLRDLGRNADDLGALITAITDIPGLDGLGYDQLRHRYDVRSALGDSVLEKFRKDRVGSEMQVPVSGVTLQFEDDDRVHWTRDGASLEESPAQHQERPTAGSRA